MCPSGAGPSWMDPLGVPMGNNPKPAQDDSSEARNCNQDQECSGLDRRLVFPCRLHVPSLSPSMPSKESSLPVSVTEQCLVFCLKAQFVLLLDLEASGCVNAAPQQGILT